MTRSGSGRTFDVLNPATLAVMAVVPDHGVGEARAAVGAAAGAFQSWASTPSRSRSEFLARTHALMLRDRDRLAALISAENGKSLTDAETEVTYAAEFFRWFAEEAVRPGGEYGESPNGGTRTIVRHCPVGVAALVTPWNFPAAMATRKMAPALAAGCAVVLKPAAETPLTALAVAELLDEAGVPEGVVNVVTTTDAPAVVGAWLQDERVRKVSFTGSTDVGRRLLHQTADRVLNASMELGGNAPFVVTEDADIDLAVESAMIAKFRNGGQACTAANRFFVHAAVLDVFVTRFGAQVEKLRVGPASDGCDIGPLISATARARVNRLIAAAEAAGARVTHQAPVPEAPGWFVAPTVMVGVAPDAEIVRDEIFGPVAPIVVWDDESEMLAQVNASEYGLAAYVFSGDLGRALRIGESIEAGMVGINRGLVSDPSAPFGGVKQSGLGREGARAGLREFQETQFLSVGWPIATARP
jgi:succinate-semialdehyde dehydrogenase/glutarate-semialdehyde dehydrogenase